MRLLCATSKELDLTNQSHVDAWFSENKPTHVYLCAAKVGGIQAAQKYCADFLYGNLMIQSNVIHAAHTHQVEKLLFVGSACSYPKHARQPLRESDLLTGPFEPTNESYSIGKMAGVKLCECYRRQHGCHFISVLPTNLYGANDNFDMEDSHVLGALIAKFRSAIEHRQKTVKLWGTGTPKREFLHADDCADACLHMMHHYDEAEPINLGSGEEISIRDLAELVAQISGFTGRIEFDHERPDGAPRRLLDTTRQTALGWKPKIRLSDGIKELFRCMK